MAEVHLSELTDELGIAYRSTPSVSFATFLRGHGSGDSLDDDGLADLVRADVQQRLALGLEIRLRDYVAVQRIGLSQVLVDAAIQAVVRGMVARGMTRAQSFAAIRTEGLGLESEIQTAEVLSSLLGSGPDLAPVPAVLPRGIGSRVDDGRSRYEMTHVLGKGSQAAVYRAIDHELSTPMQPSWVAIKLWPRGRAVGVHGKRMLAEARKARRVEHPAVLKVYDAGLTPEGEAYMVTPIIEGRTLEGIRNGPGAGAKAYVGWIVEVCAGIQAIHASGLLHRDIKPSNILVDSREHAVVTDLGLAIEIEASTERDTSGTPAFTAPEQWVSGVATSAADVYGIGATLLWCLTGELPNGENRESAERAMNSATIHRETMLPKLAKIEDRTLRAICTRAIAYVPADRYATPEGLAADLSRWLANEPLTWTKPTLADRTRMWVKRAPVMVAMTIVTALALATVPAVFAWRAVERADERIRLSEEKFAQTKESLAASLNIANFKDKWQDTSIPSLVFLEALLGPKFYTKESIFEPFWDLRLREVRRVREIVGPDTIAGMHWALVEGVWLHRNGQLDDARLVLDDALHRWTKFCPEGDPWLQQVRAMQAAAHICWMYEERKKQPPEGQRKPDLDHETALRYELALIPVIEQPTSSIPIYKMAFEALARYYDFTWTNQEFKFKELYRSDKTRRGTDFSPPKLR